MGGGGAGRVEGGGEEVSFQEGVMTSLIVLSVL